MRSEAEPEDEYAAFAELSTDFVPTGDADESGEDVDSDGSPFWVDPDIYEDGAAVGILWMPLRDMGAERVAYAFINKEGPIFNPSPYIHDVVFSVAPTINYHMLPSSKGHMLLHFDSKEDRDTVVNLSPIIYDGAHVSLERSEDTTSRFEVKLD
jgi:hypothetical protein